MPTVSPHILLLTPPLTQLNTPYPATAYIKGFLGGRGFDVTQADMGLQLVLRLFSVEGLQQVFTEIEAGSFDLSDNAQAEAGWSTLKTELLPLGTAFASLEEARLEVARYLDTYFNLDRRHSALGYRSPHQFEQDLKTNLP